MRFTFASKALAQELMGTSDEYTSSLNAYNLDWTSRSKTESEYLQKCRDSALEWTEEEREKNGLIVERFQKKLQELELNIDVEVVLVKTTGEDCNHLPYTRQNFIVFPTSTLKKEEGVVSVLNHFSLGLLVHETFHIVSRKHPELRPALYEMVGFNFPVNFNQEQHTPPKFVANPDAVHLNFVIEVNHRDQSYLATPVFEGFGKGLKLLLYNHEGKFSHWIKARKTDYYEKIKAVSGYTIHPEELLAELFRVSVTTTRKEDTNSQEDALCNSFLTVLKAYFSSGNS